MASSKAAIWMTFAAAAGTLVVAIGVIAGPTLVRCYSDPAGLLSCMRGEVVEVGLLPEPAPAPQAPEPPVSAEPQPPEPAPEAPAPQTAAPPDVNLVRAEPDGQVIIAGTSAPGIEVEVFANGDLVGKVKAEASGDWVLVPDRPLAVGTAEISVGASGSNERSPHTFTVTIAADKVSQPTITASQPIPPAPQPAPVATPEPQVAEAEPVKVPDSQVALAPPQQPQPAAIDPPTATPEPVPTPEPRLTPEPEPEPQVATAPEPESPFTAPEPNPAPQVTGPAPEAEPQVAVVPAPQPEPEPAQIPEPEPPVVAPETKPEIAAVPEPQPVPAEPPVAEPPASDTPEIAAAPAAEPEPLAEPERQVATVPEAEIEPAPAPGPVAPPPTTTPPQPVPAPVAPAVEPPPLQLAETAPAEQKPSTPPVTPVPAQPATIDAIEIDGTANYFAGAGPEGATVNLYVQDRFIASGKVEGGRWLVEAQGALNLPVQRVRIDLIEPQQGDVSARAEVNFIIDVPPPAPEIEVSVSATGSAAPVASASTALAITPQPESELEVDPAIPTLRSLPAVDPEMLRFASGKAIIRRGETLWAIAERVYGDGSQYRRIVEANDKLITRPGRIYPGQVFDLPKLEDSAPIN